MEMASISNYYKKSNLVVCSGNSFASDHDYNCFKAVLLPNKITPTGNDICEHKHLQMLVLKLNKYH